MKTSHAIAVAIAAAGLVLAAVSTHQVWTDALIGGYDLLTDRERMKGFLSGLGTTGPAAFILLQILQVIFAPFPGEVSGFIGGYLFGTLPGLLYSTIGLTAGSWINFTIGRFVGERYVRRWIAARHLNRFDTLLKRQGLIVIFFLFVFPGFPKDYLCLFLGISRIPLKFFLVASGVGRMPGTLMLSLQGAALFDEMYGMFAALLAVCLVAAGLAYRYREELYRWVERMSPPQDHGKK